MREISFYRIRTANLELCTKLQKAQNVFCTLSCLAISKKLPYNSKYKMRELWVVMGCAGNPGRIS